MACARRSFLSLYGKWIMPRPTPAGDKPPACGRGNYVRIRLQNAPDLEGQVQKKSVFQVVQV